MLHAVAKLAAHHGVAVPGVMEQSWACGMGTMSILRSERIEDRATRKRRRKTAGRGDTAEPARMGRCSTQGGILVKW